MDSRPTQRAQNLRTRLKKAITEEILVAAEAVMAERGLHAASVGEIAARAGVSVGTLYNHFEDRRALVQALYRARRDSVAPRLTEIRDAYRHEAFAVRLRHFIRDVLAMFDEYRTFIKVMTESEHLRVYDLRSEGSSSRTILSRLLECLGETFAAGVAEGKLAPGDHDLSARLAAAGLKAVILRALGADHPFTDDADALVDFILFGVSRR